MFARRRDDMQDMLLALGAVAVLAGVVITPHDPAAGYSVVWIGVFTLLAGAPFWWRGDEA